MIKAIIIAITNAKHNAITGIERVIFYCKLICTICIGITQVIFFPSFFCCRNYMGNGINLTCIQHPK